MTSKNLPAPREGAKAAKPRRLSKKLSAAIDALFDGTGKNITEAAAVAGIARETLSRAMKLPHVREEIRERTERQLTGKTLARAAGKLHQLLDAQSENVQFRATELALELNGFGAKNGPVVNNSVSIGWVIDLRRDHTKPGRMIGEEGTPGAMIIDVDTVDAEPAK
jgi:hypothetical protein